jgi:3-hydroxy-3-methylglutaryl CoA synthase
MSGSRGIISAAGYVPYRRLDRASIAKTFGSGGGRGQRAVAGYDEDTTTMGVEAARFAVKGAPGVAPAQVLFASASPAYLDKTNATTIHAALRLDEDVPALDFGGALRSGVGALRTALQGNGTALVVSADMRTGLPTSGDEANGGDGAAAILVGGSTDGPVIAELIAAASATEEFIERWRAPGSDRSKQWEERFGETKYVPLGDRAFKAALERAEIGAADVDVLAVTGMHARAAKALAGKLGATNAKAADDLTATVGNTGTAHAALVLAHALESATAGQVIALVVLADGVEVLLFRVTDAIAGYRAHRTVASQVAGGAEIAYGKFLSWKGQATLEPPRRPEPDRISASVAGRTEDYKYGFVGSKDRSSGALHLPPARVSREGGTIDDMDSVPMADVLGTIQIITIDRIAYSPSPPITFAIVDFDGGGRLPVEMTDCNGDDLRIGDRVEMTFRKLFTADDIHNYFWKARPVPSAESVTTSEKG